MSRSRTNVHLKCDSPNIFHHKCVVFQLHYVTWGFPGGLAVKNSAMQETRVQSLGWEDSSEEGMATHSSILAWRIPWTEGPGGLESIGSQRVGHS